MLMCQSTKDIGNYLLAKLRDTHQIFQSLSIWPLAFFVVALNLQHQQALWKTAGENLVEPASVVKTVWLSWKQVSAGEKQV